MRRTLVAGALVGVVFGFTLAWSGLTDPNVIFRGLLFEDSYLMLFFVAALTTAFAGTQVLRRTRPRALLTGERVELEVERPDRRRLGGAVVFGTGWAIAGACPGPIAVQLGQGVWWSLFTLTGVVVGIVLALRSQGGAWSRAEKSRRAPAALRPTSAGSADPSL